MKLPSRERFVSLNHSYARHVCVAVLAVFLSACGGGGGGGGGGGSPVGAEPPPESPETPVKPETPETPVPASAPAGFNASYGVKLYNFSWNAVSGATYYEVLEDADGTGPGAAVAVGGQLSTTNLSYSVDLLHRLNATYAVRACNAGGCGSESAVFTPDASQTIGYFKPSNPLGGGGGSQFGWSVAVSADGSTLAVGASNESSAATGIDGDQSSTGTPSSGAVYVFARVNGAWAQQAYVKASNTGIADQFGASVALSADGSTLAVGATSEDSSATGINGNESNDSASSSGAAYVFSRTGGTWAQQAYVKASNTGASDGFGISIALSADGNTLAVGAYREASSAVGINGNESDNSALSSGAAYIFNRTGGAWAQRVYVKAPNSQADQNFGYALALSGDGATLAVGAFGDASNATGINGDQNNLLAAYSGTVHVFGFDGSTWSPQAYVKASNSQSALRFGYSVALSGDGNTLAVGAPGDYSNATGVNGDQSNAAAVGSGAGYVFSRTGGTWSQQAYVKASNTAAGAEFGVSVALSADGGSLAFYALHESSSGTGIDGNQAPSAATDAGAIYSFARTGSTWAPQHYIKATNTAGSDQFGCSISLSGNGDTLVVGAFGEDSVAAGIGGDQANNSRAGTGAVYVY